VTEITSATVWLTCPKCGWRRQFSRQTVPATPRCRQCGSTIVECPPPPPPKTNPSPPREQSTVEDVELPPTSGVDHVLTPPEPEIQLAPPPTPRVPPTVASEVRRGSVQIETEHEDVVKPPRNASLYWAFTNNIFEFPFRFYALTQWIFSSVGLIAAAECAMLSLMGIMSHSQPGAIQAGVFGIASLFLMAFSFSYLSACFVDITINAAHNIDKAYDWPNPDYRERLWYLLRVAWVALLAGTIAAVIASICAVAGDVLYILFFVVFDLLFPLLLLAGLEADSVFWPVSKPVFRSLKTSWSVWAVFWVLAALMHLFCGAITWILFGFSPMLMPLIAGPLWAASIFIDARLLGRLAWFILHRAEPKEEKKKAKRKSDDDRWNL
jgi:hypothetical protein